MRVCILGAGGLGSVIGGYLAKTGVETTLIARPAHADAITRDGLRIEGVRGEHLIRDNLTAISNPADATGEFDYLILATKAKDSETALAAADCIKDRFKTVCSVQNTIVKEGILARWIGDAAKVMGASAIEGGTLEAPGFVKNHVTVPTTAYFGELDGTVSRRAQALADAFNTAGLGARAVDCIQQVLWEKLAQICNASAWSVSTLAGNNELTFVHGMALREGAEHYVAISRELLAVYGALGYTPQNFYAPLSRLKDVYECKTEEDAVQLILGFGERMKQQGYVGRTSMHDDVVRGKKTEVDYIVKPFVDKGRELGIPVPTVTAAYRIIKVLDHYLA